MNNAYRNPSYWGRVCFISTPDGENCGLVKNLALTCLASLNTDEKPVLDTLNQYGIMLVDQVSLSASKDATKIFVNGEWVGIHHDPNFLLKMLRDLRRRQHIHPQVGL